jgi:hypothetical protein
MGWWAAIAAAAAYAEQARRSQPQFRACTRSALPFLLRFLAIFVFMASNFGVHAAVGPSVGIVTKVQNQAQIGATTTVAGTPVSMNDRLRTGANARLEVTFRDKTLLTLGENANVAIDRYVYNPDKSTGIRVAKSKPLISLHLKCCTGGNCHSANMSEQLEFLPCSK